MRKINDFVQVAVWVDDPDPVAVRMYRIPLRVADVPNPEPVAVLNAMCRPTAVSPVDAPPAP